MLALVAFVIGVVALAHTAPFPLLIDACRPSGSLWHVQPTPGAGDCPENRGLTAFLNTHNPVRRH